MLPKKIVESVINLTSGIRAKEYASTIARFHRIQISPGIHNAIEYVRKEAGRISNEGHHDAIRTGVIDVSLGYR